ncbi:large ribosomal subunit protein bL28 [Candidatus Carsonella ruddii]|uniref:50S ribosomal protein L28 n=1 Tax=Candidatus Carsonella ruddii (Diaphorina cf. continua) TaxID=2661587 RepID=A0A7R7AAW5_CARRU|nr:L28 family ribosomal protein [Candidatus Carsonella ruddii (Diaphorina cf. continua)]BCG49355.1 50S ribosomal protein L28 [Candidatus Carsonella ruddii (Diaphorina cf. continua)]
MSNICILTKKKKISKNKVSHSNKKNKTFNKSNFHKFSLWVCNFFLKIRISSKSIKILKKCIF